MSKFVVKQTNKGKGVFTINPIKSGDVITEWTGPILTAKDIPHPYQSIDDLYTQIGNGIFMGPSGKIDDLINHSCDPNCGIKFHKKKIYLIAIRDILPEEEITWDYATTMNDSGISDIDEWELACKCGSNICRGVVRNFEILPKEIKEKYINLGIIPDYILKLNVYKN